MSNFLFCRPEKKELTEEEIKQNKMRELIEKDKLKQQQDLEESKKKQMEEKKLADETTKTSEKVDLLNDKDGEFNFDDI